MDGAGGRTSGAAVAPTLLLLLLLLLPLSQAPAHGPRPAVTAQPAPPRVNQTLLAELLGTAAPRPFVGAFSDDRRGRIAAHRSASAASPADSNSHHSSRPSPGGRHGSLHTPPPPPPPLTAHRASSSIGAAVDAWAYALYNPRFNLTPGDLSPEEAAEHYERVGRASNETVICARIPVYISYHTGGGLCSMAFNELHAWTLAVALGADVLLPRVHRRLSFAQEEGYEEVPFGTLFDERNTMALLAGLGVQAAPELRIPAAASNRTVLTLNRFRFPEGFQSGEFDSPTRHLSSMVDAVLQEVLSAVRRKHKADGLSCDQPPVVHLDMHTQILYVRHARLPLGAYLAGHILFSSVVRRRAQLIQGLMAKQGLSKYNGLHLRLELDHKSTSAASFGNETSMLMAYASACRRMQWAAAQPPLPVYVASGLFTYREGVAEYNRAVQYLAQACGSVFVHREQFEQQLGMAAALASTADGDGGGGRGEGGSDDGGGGRGDGGGGDSQGASSQAAGTAGHTGRYADGVGGGGRGAATVALQPLDSEQAAAVDHLMMVAAHQFVGTTGSSFSWFTAQQRVLHYGRSALDAGLAGYWPSRAEVGNRSYPPACFVRSCVEGEATGI